MVDEDSFRRSIDELLRRLWPAVVSPDHRPQRRDELAALYAVFADWLEEQGDERAAGYRWLARQGKFPRRGGSSWDWWRFGNHEGTAPEDLPNRVWDRLPGTANVLTAQCKEYVTPEAAERAVCKAIRRLETA